MTVELLFDQLRARTTEPQSLADPIEVNALATPALVLNRANFEANLTKMADHVDAFDKGFRPHAKTHKCQRLYSSRAHWLSRNGFYRFDFPIETE